MNDFVDITAANCQKYLEQILEIENVSFPSPWSLNSFLQEVKNPISHLSALIASQRLSGYICFWLFASEIQVLNIAVHPERRSQGLGKTLLSKMIEEGIAKGMQTIWLEVRESNRAAKSLYEKLGFKAINHRRKYYRDTDEDALIMALRLSTREDCPGVLN